MSPLSFVERAWFYVARLWVWSQCKHEKHMGATTLYCTRRRCHFGEHEYWDMQ